MLNRILIMIIFIQVVIYGMYYFKPNVSFSSDYKVSVDDDINVDEMKLENYVIGVVAAEMPATFSIESLKAQAVAARTFAYKKLVNKQIDIDDIKEDKGQAYITVKQMKEKWNNSFDKNYEKVSKAVLETKGEIITYKDKPINAYYFSMSNGSTEDSQNVFHEEDYLVSVSSPWDKNVNNFEVTNSYSIGEVLKKLDLSEKGIVISKINRNETNHVENITINNKEFTGIEIRKKLGLRSTDFDITLTNDLVKVKTRGYGHGVGMSQYGANYLGNNGHNYKEILSYYYKDVTYTKI